MSKIFCDADDLKFCSSLFALAAASAPTFNATLRKYHAGGYPGLLEILEYGF